MHSVQVSCRLLSQLLVVLTQVNDHFAQVVTCVVNGRHAGNTGTEVKKQGLERAKTAEERNAAYDCASHLDPTVE